MTRRHFGALAEALARVRLSVVAKFHTADYNAGVRDQWFRTRQAVADVCQQFNPNFDRDKFYAACEETDE